MRHFSCDGCGKDLTDDIECRYVIHIEAHATQDPSELTEHDLDTDAIEQTAALLTSLDDGLLEEGDLAPLPARAAMEYDLCPNCYRHYLKDPLGRATRQSWAFSEN
ncbi:MAG: hypothetical protein U0798_01710 [Gemmataceae bacterium]